MRTRSKLIFAALTASLLMGLAVSSASANRLSVSNTRFRITWPSLNLNRGEDGTTLIECAVTLEGSFHSATIRKIQGALIGHVSRANVKNETCTGGRATILQERLPWHVTYDSFTGTLPNITGVKLLLHRTAFKVSVLGELVTCLYQENGVKRARGTVIVGAGGAITGINPDELETLPKFEGSGLCPATGSLSEVGSVMVLGNTTTISVRLI